VALIKDISSEIVTLNDNNHTQFHSNLRGRRGCDRMAVGFTTTCAISAYHHWYEFESRSGRGIQHYVIKFVSNLGLGGGFPWVLRFPPPIKLTATILLKVALNTLNQTYILFIFFIYSRSKYRDLSKIVDSMCLIKDILIDWFTDWCLTPTLAIFQLYRGVN
jgi:hypothetical protein